LIPKGERSGLLTRIATESVSLCAPMKLTAFLEPGAAILAGNYAPPAAHEPKAV
jgi:hypothetical protein